MNKPETELVGTLLCGFKFSLYSCSDGVIAIVKDRHEREFTVMGLDNNDVLDKVFGEIKKLV